MELSNSNDAVRLSLTTARANKNTPVLAGVFVQIAGETTA
jgi:hypothetical protein